MAIVVGDVSYKISADTTGLLKAIKEVERIGAAAEKSAKSIQRLQSVKDIGYKVTVNTTGLLKAVKDIEKVGVAAEKSLKSVQRLQSVKDIGFKVTANTAGLLKATTSVEKLGVAAEKTAKSVQGLRSVGDISYKVSADTSGLLKATKEVKQFGVVADKSIKSVQRLQSIGDISYKISADTAGLLKAIKEVEKLGVAAEKSAKSVQRLQDQLDRRTRALGNAAGDLSQQQSRAGNAAVASATRQQKALASLQSRYEKLKTAVNRAGAPPEITASAATSLRAFERAVKRGIGNADEFARAQARVNRVFDQSSQKLTNFRNEAIDSAKKIRSVSNAGIRVEDLVQGVNRAGGSPELVNRARAALDDYTRALSAGRLGTVQLAQANAQLNERLAGVRRGLADLHGGIGRSVSLLGTFTDAIKSVGLAFAAFLIFSTVQDALTGLARMTESFKLLQARVRLAVGSVELATVAIEELRDISNETHTSLEKNIALFARLAQAGKAVGASQQDMLDVTKAFAASVRISGSTMEEANASALQFAQGLASGKLAGDELKSVLENNQRLTEALVAGFNRVNPALHVTVGNIRDLAAAGKLTAQDLVQALISQLPKLEQELKGMPLTVGQAWQDLQNNILVAVGALDSATGSTSLLAEAIEWLADVVEKITPPIQQFGRAVSGTLSPTEKLSNTMKGAAVAGILFSAAFKMIGAAITNFALLPVKLLLDALGTLIDVFINLSAGEWEKAGTRLLEGVKGIKDAISDAGTGFFDDIVFDARDAARKIEEVFDESTRKAREAGAHQLSTVRVVAPFDFSQFDLALQKMRDTLAQSRAELQGFKKDAISAFKQAFDAASKNQKLGTFEDFLTKTLPRAFKEAGVKSVAELEAAFERLPKLAAKFGLVKRFLDFQKVAKSQEELNKRVALFADITSEAFNPVQQYANTVARLNDLLKNSPITVDQYNRAMRQARETLLNTDETSRNTFNALSTGFDTLISNLRDGENAFDSFAHAIDDALTSVLKRLNELLIIEPLAQSLAKSIRSMNSGGSGGSGGFLDTLKGFGGSVMGYLFGGGGGGTAAGGGVQTAPLQALPAGSIQEIPFMASGGSLSARKPAIIGEQGPELFVPSTNGTVVPNSALGGSNVVVNINNYAEGVQATATTRQGPDGQKIIDVMVEQSFKRLLAKGSMDKALAANMGIRRRGKF